MEEVVLRHFVLFTNSLECKMLCADVERGRRCRRSKDTWINENSKNVNFLFDMLSSSPLKDVHHAVAEDARHPVHLVGGEAGEDEAPGLVVADAALVLHLVGHELVIGVVILVQSISP